NSLTNAWILEILFLALAVSLRMRVLSRSAYNADSSLEAPCRLRSNSRNQAYQPHFSNHRAKVAPRIRRRIVHTPLVAFRERAPGKAPRRWTQGAALHETASQTVGRRASL